VLILCRIFNKRQNEDQNALLNTVPLSDTIPLGVPNRSHRSKNRSASFTAVIVVETAKYPENFVYLLTITRIALATSPVLILVGGKPVIKSIINSNMGPCGIGSTDNSPYGRCLGICTLWHVLYLNT